MRAPDLVGQLRVDEAWGLSRFIAAHHNQPTYYTATNEASGHPDAKWGWAGQLALSVKNIPTGVGDSINIQAVKTEGATRYNFQNLAPTNYAMYSGTGTADAGHKSLGLANAADTVYANGTQQENDRT